MKAAVVFPYFHDERYEDVAEAAFERQYAACKECGFDLIFVSDGPMSKRFDSLLTGILDERPEKRTWMCKYRKLSVREFQDRKGLTRSWNFGAEHAFMELECEVVVLSNFDAWPATEEDLEELCSVGEEFYAAGPYTENPGHCPRQSRDNWHAGNAGDWIPVAWLNGFTWAISRAMYEATLSARGFFLCENPEVQFRFLFFNGVRYGGVLQKTPEGATDGLNMSGQEDELFLWANQNLNRVCGIAPCFWHHDKQQSHRDL